MHADRTDGKAILNLPGRKVEIVQCPFDAEERAFYDALEQKTALTFNKVGFFPLSDGNPAESPVFESWHYDVQLYFRLDNASADASR